MQQEVRNNIGLLRNNPETQTSDPEMEMCPWALSETLGLSLIPVLSALSLTADSVLMDLAVVLGASTLGPLPPPALVLEETKEEMTLMTIPETTTGAFPTLLDGLSPTTPTLLLLGESTSLTLSQS